MWTAIMRALRPYLGLFPKCFGFFIYLCNGFSPLFPNLFLATISSRRSLLRRSRLCFGILKAFVTDMALNAGKLFSPFYEVWHLKQIVLYLRVLFIGLVCYRPLGQLRHLAEFILKHASTESFLNQRVQR